MVIRKRITLVPLGDVQQFKDYLDLNEDDTVTLGVFLARFPAFSTSPIEASTMEQKLKQLFIKVVQEPSDVPLYRPPGLVVTANSPQAKVESAPSDTQSSDSRASSSASKTEQVETQPETLSTPPDDSFPTDISEKRCCETGLCSRN